MVTQAVETPAEPAADPEPQVEQTEVPTPVEEVADAAAEPEAAAVEPVEVVEPEKPNYVTREELEAERQRAASEAIEADRRRRQTENARKAQQEERSKARLAQTVDTVRATLVSRGFDPEVATDQSVVTAIDRVAQERADSILREQGDLIAPAWDYLIGAAEELDESAKPTATALRPKLQALIDTIRPQIEAKAREGYIPESELGAKVDAEIARRQAKAREDKTELVRPEGTPAPLDNSTVEERLDRLAKGKPTDADVRWWNEREKARGRG